MAAAILVTTAKEIPLVSVFPRDCAFHVIQSPFEIDSSFNARRSVLANGVILICLDDLWRSVELSASLRRFMSDGRLDSRIVGGIKSYLFARFLTILTDCSVESQRVVLKWKSEQRGRETYGCLVGSGLSKLAHTDALPEWMGWLCCGKP